MLSLMANHNPSINQERRVNYLFSKFVTWIYQARFRLFTSLYKYVLCLCVLGEGGGGGGNQRTVYVLDEP